MLYLYIGNDKVVKTTKKLKKSSIEQVLVSIFEWCLYIKPSHLLNASEILYDSLRWNPELKRMTRTDQNAVMLEVFQKKQMISTALISVKLLLEEYEKRSMIKINREIVNGKYNNDDIDRTIAKLVWVMKMDMVNVKQHIMPHIYNKDLKAHQIFYFLNSTAKIAADQQSPWLSIVSQNAMCTKLFYKGRMPITQFLINADIGFDEEQYKLEEERAKERNLSSVQFRNHLALHRDLFKNISSSFRGGGTNRTSKQGDSNKFKEMMNYHNNFLKIYKPGKRWSMNHCGFWNHPSLSCKFGDKCSRKHCCSNCEGTHKLKDCPKVNKSNISQINDTNP